MKYSFLRFNEISYITVSQFCVAVLCCSILILLGGCDYSSTITDPISSSFEETSVISSNSLPPVIDGRIVFDDLNRFQIFLESIVNKDDTHLDSIEAEMNFVSLRSDTERLAEELGKEIEEVEIVMDKYFATALNPLGEYQIGDVVHKVTRSFIYSINESKSGLLDAIGLRNNEFETVYHKSGHHPEVEVFEIQRFPDPDIAYKTGEVQQSNSQCTSEFFDRRRIWGNVWLENNGTHYTLQSVLKSQRKGFLGGWYGSTIDWLLVDGSYDFSKGTYRSFPGRPWLDHYFMEPLSSGEIYGRGYNTKRIEHTHYDFSGDNSNSTILGTVSLKFSGQRTDKGKRSKAECSGSFRKSG